MTSKNTEDKRTKGRPKLGRTERFTVRTTRDVAKMFRKQADLKDVSIPDHFEELVDAHQATIQNNASC